MGFATRHHPCLGDTHNTEHPRVMLKLPPGTDTTASDRANEGAGSDGGKERKRQGKVREPRKKKGQEIDPDYRRDIIVPRSTPRAEPTQAPAHHASSSPSPRDRTRSKAATQTSGRREKGDTSGHKQGHKQATHTPRTKAALTPFDKAYMKFKELETKSKQSESPNQTYLERLQAEGKTLLLLACERAVEKNVLVRMWAVALAHTGALKKQIQKLTREIEKNGDSPDLTSALSRAEMGYSRLLGELDRFYSGLLEAITAEHSSEMSQSLDTGAEFACTRVCHSCLLTLGDINRYAKEVDRARFLYLRALGLIPRDGKAHNQLAIVTAQLNQGNEGGGTRSVDTMYHYFRAIACPTPFDARQNLISLFEKNRTKYAELTAPRRRPPKDQSGNSEMTLTGLVRLHGILFTRISFETFDAICAACLGELQPQLISSIISGTTLLKLLLSAVFVVHDTLEVPRGDPSVDLAPRITLASTYSIGLAFDMATCAIRAALSSGNKLLNLLCTITVFCRWCSLYPALLGLKANESVQCFLDSMCALVNSLGQVQPNVGPAQGTAVEELECRGFGPLMDLAGNAPLTPLEPEAAFEVAVVQIRETASMWTELQIIHNVEGKYVLQPVAQVPSVPTNPIRVINMAAPTADTLPPVTSLPPPPALTGGGSDLAQLLGAVTVFGGDEVPAGDELAVGEQREYVQDAMLVDEVDGVDEEAKEKEEDASPGAPMPQFAMQVVSAETQQLSTIRQRLASSATTASAITRPLVVLDAPNIAMRHGKNKHFQSLGVRLCADHYRREGHKVVAFLPDFFLDYDKVANKKRMATAGYDVRASQLPDDVMMLKTLAEEDVVVPTPEYDYDDSYCIQYAYRHNGFIVTNDKYRDSKIPESLESAGADKGKRWMEWIRSHSISYTFVGDEFLPNPDFRFPEASSMN